MFPQRLHKLLFACVPSRLRRVLGLARQELAREWWQYQSVRKAKDLMKAGGSIRLELGGGGRSRPGWLNVDLAASADLRLDLGRPLPFTDQSVDAIYSSHVLEHFSYPVPLRSFLSECFRILKVGGTFRAAVPDGGRAFRSYAAGCQQFVSDRHWSHPQPNWCRCPMDDLNFLAYMDGHHHFLFDETNLVIRLKEAGFGEVSLVEYDEAIDLPERRDQSLFVTAVRTSADPQPLWLADKRGVTWRVFSDDNLPDRFYGSAYFNDAGTLDFTQRLLRPGMTVIDVGAHWGEFALFAVECVQPGGVVHAFEPTAHSYSRLKENTGHSRGQSGCMVLNKAAVWDHDGQAVINTFPQHYATWNTMGKPKMFLPGGKVIEPVSSEVVEAVTLDTYCQRRQVSHVDLLKIDVEGFEADVIRGCSEMLRQSRIDTIIFEISRAPLKGAGRSARETLEAIASHGLRISRIGEGGKLFPIDSIESHEAPFFANYVAKRAGTGEQQ